MEKLLSTKDIASILKQSEQHVRSLIRNGKLKAVQVGKSWVSYPQDVDDYVRINNIVIEPDDHKRESEKLPEIVALSFFSGAMGLDIGMENGGIEAVLACEFDKACRTTIKANKPAMALIGDINNYSADEILKMANIPVGHKVDVIFGGPPCQAFSTAGKRLGLDDHRGNVFLSYLNIIDGIRPEYVVIENVRGLLSAPYPYPDQEIIIKGGALMLILDRMRLMGYGVKFNLYNAANFGAPQIRERVVIIAKKDGGKVPYLTPTHSDKEVYGLPKWRTLKDAFKHMKTSESKMHHVDFPENRLVYYRILKAGQYWKDLPVELQKEAMGKSFYLEGGKTGFLRRLSYDKPSPTLVTHPAMPATDLGHPTNDRPLSVEEYKCIQEFPSDWNICGSMLEQYKQIGNAVPIKLGQAIANTIIKDMEGTATPSIPEFPYSRYKNTDEKSWEHEFKKSLEKLKKGRQNIIHYD